MAKVDVDLVKAVLRRNIEDSRAVARIVEDINTELKQLEMEDEAKEPPVKKQFVMVVSDPDGVLEDRDLAGWIVQIPEDEAAQSALEKLHQSAYAYNVTKKGRRYPAETIGDVCEAVPPKIAKEQKLWIKTKEPVLVVRTDNTVPQELGGGAAKKENQMLGRNRLHEGADPDAEDDSGGL